MLDAFIIEELKKQQAEELAKELERPRLEIPSYIPLPIPDVKPEENKETIIYIEI